MSKIKIYKEFFSSLDPQKITKDNIYITRIIKEELELSGSLLFDGGFQSIGDYKKFLQKIFIEKSITKIKKELEIIMTMKGYPKILLKLENVSMNWEQKSLVLNFLNDIEETFSLNDLIYFKIKVNNSETIQRFEFLSFFNNIQNKENSNSENPLQSEIKFSKRDESFRHNVILLKKTLSKKLKQKIEEISFLSENSQYQLSDEDFKTISMNENNHKIDNNNNDGKVLEKSDIKIKAYHILDLSSFMKRVSDLNLLERIPNLSSFLNPTIPSYFINENVWQYLSCSFLQSISNFLSKNQFDILNKIISPSSKGMFYSLVKGIPGTGKKRLIVSLMSVFYTFHFSKSTQFHTNRILKNFCSREDDENFNNLSPTPTLTPSSTKDGENDREKENKNLRFKHVFEESIEEKESSKACEYEMRFEDGPKILFVCKTEQYLDSVLEQFSNFQLISNLGTPFYPTHVRMGKSNSVLKKCESSYLKFQPKNFFDSYKNVNVSETLELIDEEEKELMKMVNELKEDGRKKSLLKSLESSESETAWGNELNIFYLLEELKKRRIAKYRISLIQNNDFKTIKKFFKHSFVKEAEIVFTTIKNISNKYLEPLFGEKQFNYCIFGETEKIEEYKILKILNSSLLKVVFFSSDIGNYNRNENGNENENEKDLLKTESVKFNIFDRFEKSDYKVLKLRECHRLNEEVFECLNFLFPEFVKIQNLLTNEFSNKFPFYFQIPQSSQSFEENGNECISQSLLLCNNSINDKGINNKEMKVQRFCEVWEEAFLELNLNSFELFICNEFISYNNNGKDKELKTNIEKFLNFIFRKSICFYSIGIIFVDLNRDSKFNSLNSFKKLFINDKKYFFNSENNFLFFNPFEKNNNDINDNKDFYKISFLNLNEIEGKEFDLVILYISHSETKEEIFKIENSLSKIILKSILVCKNGFWINFCSFEKFDLIDIKILNSFNDYILSCKKKRKYENNNFSDVISINKNINVKETIEERIDLKENRKVNLLRRKEIDEDDGEEETERKNKRTKLESNKIKTEFENIFEEFFWG